MKKWMTVLVFGGLLSTAAVGASATAEVAGDEAIPCNPCCPPHICGLNGPSLDGTTEPAECPAR